MRNIGGFRDGYEGLEASTVVEDTTKRRFRTSLNRILQRRQAKRMQRSETALSFGGIILSICLQQGPKTSVASYPTS